MTPSDATGPTGPTLSSSPAPGGRFLREGLVLLAFSLLTVLMTWPWAAWIRDAVPDQGDPYLNSWILWWDWHATFHDPQGLFHANIFYPYRWTLAFSENDYGLALPLFPLFALGVRPLTVHGIAMLLGYALSGYGAFRLARTLTGSTGAAWVAGIAFAFVPYHFHQISHVNYTFTAWVPLVLEAAVLFARRRTWPRAAWLGVAFLMNGLTCIHWLLLSAIPLAVSTVLLALREGADRDRAFWTRGTAAVGGASLLLLPFLVPYQVAAKLYGFTRSEAEALDFSARPAHWLTADPLNKLWDGLGVSPAPGELALFPGLLPLLLALAAVVLVRPGPEPDVAAPARAPRRGLLLALDAIAVLFGTVALLASAESGFVVRHGSRVLLSATKTARPVAVLGLVLLVRWMLAWPVAFPFRGRNLLDSFRRARRPEALHVGLAFALIGFFGSFGMRFPFHAVLFRVLPPFRSIRVPARWAMMADLGLALLAGLGALALARAVADRWPARRRVSVAVFAVAGVLLLLEDRIAPLGQRLVRGAADPDEATEFLAKTPMKGGIVELPTSFPGPYEAMLRAADHGKPLVNAVSGFTPPIVARLEGLLAERPIPDALVDHLESIPTSYVVVHESRLLPEERAALHAVLFRALAADRLRLVGRFDGRRRNDVYAVTKSEPRAPRGSPAWSFDAELQELAPKKLDDSLVGSVDNPADGEVVHGNLLVRGWARSEDEDYEVTLLLDGELRKPSAFRRVPRADVAAAFPRFGLCETAGYEAEFPFEPGDEGRREIRAVFRARDGRVRLYPIRTFRWEK